MIWLTNDQAAPQDQVAAEGLRQKARETAGEKKRTGSNGPNSPTAQSSEEKSCSSCSKRAQRATREALP